MPCIILNWHRAKAAQIDSLSAMLLSITCQGPFVQGGDGCQGEAGKGRIWTEYLWLLPRGWPPFHPPKGSNPSPQNMSTPPNPLLRVSSTPLDDLHVLSRYSPSTLLLSQTPPLVRGKVTILVVLVHTICFSPYFKSLEGRWNKQ